MHKKSLYYSLLRVVNSAENAHTQTLISTAGTKNGKRAFFVALLFPCALHDRKIIRPRGGCPCVIGAVERQWLFIENVFCSLFSIVNVLGF